MRILILSFSLLMSPLLNAQTSCWILTDLSGKTYSQADGYKAVTDSISYPIRLVLDGDNTSANPSDLPMMQMEEFMAVAVGQSEAFSTVETYQVDPVFGIVTHTKAITGKSVFSGITGVRSFVGKAQRCNP